MFDDVKSCAGKKGFVCGPSFEFGPDADIAGVGVFAAFIAAAGLSFIFASVSLVIEAFQYFDKDTDQDETSSHRKFLDAFLVSLSDTQIVTSLALLIATNFKVGCTISAYHYDLVCNLVLISSATHIGSMIVVHKYFGQKWWLGAVRCVMVAVNFGFACALFSSRNSSGIFPSFKPYSNIPNDGTFSTGLSLPAACYLGHPNAPKSGYPNNFTSTLSWFPWMSNTTSHLLPNSTIISNSSLSGDPNSFIPGTNVTWPLFEQFSSNDHLTNVGDVVALAFLILAFLAAIATSTWLSMSNEPRKHLHTFAYPLRCGSFLATYIIMLYGIAQFFQLRGWMKNSGLFNGDDGEDNKIETFGQLMPIVLLALPILALLEQFASNHAQPEEQRNGYRLSSKNSNTDP